MSVSALLKAALRNYLGSPISVDPGVYQGHSPEPPEAHLAGMFPVRHPARPSLPPKLENRPLALGHDRPDRLW
jgi:hypothetical protein